MDSRVFKSLLLLSSFIIVFSKANSVAAADHTLTSSSSPNSSNNSLVNTTRTTHLSAAAMAACKSTPFPDSCFHSAKLSISINISPNVLSIILQSLNSALSEGFTLLKLLADAGGANLVEKQRGTIQDCRDLHQITLSSLKKSLSWIKTPGHSKLANARTSLSASLTNKVTCLEGLSSASGPMKSSLETSLTSAYSHVSNSLSLLPRRSPPPDHRGRNRRLLGFPSWLPRKARRILSSDYRYDPSEVDIIVSADGTGDFTTISDAINFAPDNSDDRTFIYIREGVYNENVEIPSWKPNIVFLGDGTDLTVISGSRSAGDGWTTYRSATVAVSGQGFLARDITFTNTAGAAKGQAVALRINADYAAVYKCNITGFQDTLYVHSFRQFYRECDIYGTIDYIFGNAAAVFQACNIYSRLPMPGQGTVIAAQSRQSLAENTGISFQNCSVLATEELRSKSSTVKSYLGRPWRNYSTTVYMKSYIDGFIAPEGWSKWDGDQGLHTLYYGEYGNYGPGASLDNRVTWEGYHRMDDDDASGFTVSELIDGQTWLDSTSFPFDDGV
ncbi:probable pectinesterase/pectinesterase inhibitor 12 [Andrographis paniculata]|uniref:probable pectinesterase/pectinesterase inhibitor 12 n=1 Tax=Andrographis paniculata TaxID=175694 RepID=UPI0021E8FB30|nr:probable pectinesterase/pectinesterase inhibitor 12 [Andrographis paniculata]